MEIDARDPRSLSFIGPSSNTDYNNMGNWCLDNGASGTSFRVERTAGHEQGTLPAVMDCSNGKFLYWFHNHGGKFIGELGPAGKDGRTPYDDRNPAWLMAGCEINTPQGKMIAWSQPEILLHDDDPFIRMSYPDLVEDGGKFFVTETQKNIGRVHEIPKVLVDGLFNQFECRTAASDGLVLKASAAQLATKEVTMPKLPELNKWDIKSPDMHGQDLRTGFSLDLWLQLDSLVDGQIVLDSHSATGQGLLVTMTEHGAINLMLNDDRQAVAVFADLERFPKRQVFPLDRLPDDLLGFQGAAEFNFYGSRFRRQPSARRKSICWPVRMASP